MKVVLLKHPYVSLGTYHHHYQHQQPENRQNFIKFLTEGYVLLLNKEIHLTYL